MQQQVAGCRSRPGSLAKSSKCFATNFAIADKSDNGSGQELIGVSGLRCLQIAEEVEVVACICVRSQSQPSRPHGVYLRR